jgi:L-alanine-DL-glutamate epimerase-like enolase superfamily enzyme
MKVAALAETHCIDLAPHGSQDVHIHLVSAASNGLILEFYSDTTNPMWGKMFKETLRINDDGTVSPPDAPGLGVDPNYAELERFRVL